MFLWLSVGPLFAAAPRIISQPEDQTNLIGSTVQFTAIAEGDAPLRYQWRAYLPNQFTNVPGATNFTLTLTNIQPTTRRFALHVTNHAGSATSRLAILTVLRPPTFITNPASTIVLEGADVNFAVHAQGLGPIRYQWHFEGLALPDKTNTSLALGRVFRTNEGDYYAVATNPYGASTSRVARLRVTPPPESLEARVLSGGAAIDLPYRLFVPTASADATPGPYPLVLALAQLEDWPHPMVFISYTNQFRFPLIFVAPQDSPVSQRLFDLLDALIAELPVDTNRIYVTGLSIGGYGSWELPRLRPSFFAASVPIAGWGTPSQANVLKNLSIWNFHSASDSIVPVNLSRDMIRAVRAAGGRPIYTEYAGGTHAIWAEAWATPGLVEWTLSQRLAEPSPLPPRLVIANLVRTGDVAITATTNLLLSGESHVFDAPLTAITWTNLLSQASGTGIGISDWIIENLPILPTGTNPVLVVGSTSSFTPGLGGSTTVNDFVRLVYQSPIHLTAALSGNKLSLAWSGGTGPYRLQTALNVDAPVWVDLVSPATSPLEVTTETNRSFFRLVSGDAIVAR